MSMFINSNFVYIDEAQQKLNVTKNWLIMAFKKNPDFEDAGLVIKIGNCRFFDCVQNPFKHKITDFTDFSRLLPLAYLKRNFGFDPNFCKFGKVVEFFGKKWFEFDSEFYNAHKRDVWYHCKADKLDDFKDFKTIQVSKNDFIVIY